MECWRVRVRWLALASTSLIGDQRCRHSKPQRESSCGHSDETPFAPDSYSSVLSEHSDERQSSSYRRSGSSMHQEQHLPLSQCKLLPAAFCPQQRTRKECSP